MKKKVEFELMDGRALEVTNGTHTPYVDGNQVDERVFYTKDGRKVSIENYVVTIDIVGDYLPDVVECDGE